MRTRSKKNGNAKANPFHVEFSAHFAPNLLTDVPCVDERARVCVSSPAAGVRVRHTHTHTHTLTHLTDSSVPLEIPAHKRSVLARSPT